MDAMDRLSLRIVALFVAPLIAFALYGTLGGPLP